MGKKQKKEATNVTAETFKIHKNKSLTANLSQFIRVLKIKHSDLPTKEYLNHIHKFIYNFSKKKGALPQSLVVETTSKIKICKKCDKWAMGTKKMVQCEACQDHYHIECAKKYVAKKDWRCESCSSLRVSQVSQQSQQKQIECSKCAKNKNQFTIKCLKCQKSFHQSCYAGQAVVCGGCSKEIQSKIKQQKQLTLRESFKIAQQNSKRKSEQIRNELPNIFKKSRQSVQLQKEHEEDRKTDQNKLDKEINQSTNGSTIFASCKRFKAGFPEMTPQEIEKYKQNLMFAILSKNMEYSEKLQCHDCSLYDDNEDSVDFAILHLSMSDMKMFKNYQKQPIGPFLLQYKQECGYDVVADKDLPKGMIVCEYVGDVYTFRNALRLQANDSIMQLKKGKNADESLLIVPRKFTNIARFINGINEDDPQKAQKQNVQTVRALAQGRPVVILYTLRNVKKGESLLYNYGAGIAKVRYDTSSYQ